MGRVRSSAPLTGTASAGSRATASSAPQAHFAGRSVGEPCGAGPVEAPFDGWLSANVLHLAQSVFWYRSYLFMLIYFYTLPEVCCLCARARRTCVASPAAYPEHLLAPKLMES